MTNRSAVRTVIPIREEFGRYREPTLDEILSDPIMEAVMRADSVDRDELDDMLSRIADELQAAFLTTVQNPRCFGPRRSPPGPYGGA